MAEGGTLPFKITQLVTLYNTTGVIEKEKNIYFSPLLESGNATPICNRWLAGFNTECSPSAEYTDINISKWSPQDRKLVLRGNVDDFRVVTEHGKALNYLILKRDIYSEESLIEDRVYYAFFITDVGQAGQGSVVLTLEPDHFTNVFWLHNNDAYLTGEGYYDPYNKSMKNCYVERQHYNRVKVAYTVEEKYFDNTSTYRFRLNYLEISTSKPDKQVADVDLISISINNIDYTSQYTFDRYILTTDNIVYVFRFTGENPPSSGSLEASISVTYSTLEEDNLPIFSQIEESFKYKRQFRDYKKWLNYGTPLSDADISKLKTMVDNGSAFLFRDDTDIEWKNKILRSCYGFVVVTLSNITTVLKLGHDVTYRPQSNYDNSEVKKNLTTVIFPVRIFPRELKFAESYLNSAFAGYLRYHGTHNLTYVLNNDNPAYADVTFFSYSIDYVNRMLGEGSPFSQYVISAYLTRENKLMDFISYKEADPTHYIFECDEISSNPSDNNNDYPYIAPLIFGTDETGLPYGDNNAWTNGLAGVMNGNIYIKSHINLQSPSNTRVLNITLPNDYSQYLRFFTGFMLKENAISFDIDLEDKVEKNPKEDYYDPVLSFNPYSFYSISYLGRIENILNKVNYYEKPNFTLNLNISVADVFKVSIVPEYTVEGFKQLFYSEGIEQTMTNDITVLSSKTAEYLIANRSQMKNQYAVNDERNRTEMINSGIKGGADTISSGIKGASIGGWQGGLAGTVSGLVKAGANLIAGALSWDSSIRIITMNQKAKLADLGNMPSNLKQVGTDLAIDLSINELGFYLNHYTIDEVSYNSICKYLERFGYMVNIYDNLNVNTRVGWDYVQLISFDYEAIINIEQEESIRQIFAEGVTLLHDKSYMTSRHNYELILEEVI